MMGSRFVASGEYELLEKLAQGGMGEVWRARQRGPGGFERSVVIKRILPHLSDDKRFIEMFLSEARLSARLQHPNIVQVLNLGYDPSGYFIAIEHVSGHPLSKVIGAFDTQTPPPVGLGALVVRDISRALAYAWELPGDDGRPLGLVHRDVSPSNVMIGFGGTAKLLDFGVAKALAHAPELNPATETGVLKGKLWYMAPERIAGEPFDHRADLFSAGVVLHEALTGWRLFDGASVSEIAAMMRKPVEPPSRLNPAVPPALDAICLRALATDPGRRFSSGRDLAAALDTVLFDLKWGAAELGVLMRTLFDSEAAAAASEDLGLASTQHDDRRRPEPQRHVVATSAMGQRAPEADSDRTLVAASVRQPENDSERTVVGKTSPLPAGGARTTLGRAGTDPVNVDRTDEIPAMPETLDESKYPAISGPLDDEDTVVAEKPSPVVDEDRTLIKSAGRDEEPAMLHDDRTLAGTITVPTPRLAPEPLVHERPVLLQEPPTLGSLTAPPTVVTPRRTHPGEERPRRSPRKQPQPWLIYVVAAAIAVAGAGALVALKVALAPPAPPAQSEPHTP
jgi:serine/threonine protein kinase